MSQLISLRHRIKAVETTKKITHAMRLISMSHHARLRSGKEHFKLYKKTFKNLWDIVHYNAHGYTPEHKNKPKNMIVIIGSQKGLCGNFNSHLFEYLEQQFPELTTGDVSSYDLVSAGKHATDYLRYHGHKPFASYDDLRITNFVHISYEISSLIIRNKYTNVTVVSNALRNFFVQKPQTTALMANLEAALTETDQKDPQKGQIVEFLWEQSPAEIQQTIKQQMLAIFLQELLYESLLAEQAARFLSMDTATRNAHNLIVVMQLEYNKTRQSAITRELTELSSAFVME